MPYAIHLRLSARCIVVDGAGAPIEEAQYQVNIGRPDSGNLVFDQQRVDDYGQDFAAFHANPASKISGACRLQEVRAALIGPDGKYTADPLSWFGDVPGGTPGLFLPLQMALTVSTETARRGSSGRGRFFLPTPALGIFPDGRIAESDATSVATAAAEFISALGNMPGVDAGDQVPVIASTKGFNTPITGVRVGRVLDTIRTRRGSLEEGYIRAPLAAAP